MNQDPELFTICFDAQEKLFFGFSKKQVDIIVLGEELSECSFVNKCLFRVVWNEKQMPLLFLDNFFGLSELSPALPKKIIFLKSVVDGQIKKIAIPLLGGVESCSVGSLSVGVAEKEKPLINNDFVLGQFKSKKGDIIVPDLSAIAKKISC